jgi:hypothetical protein
MHLVRRGRFNGAAISRSQNVPELVIVGLGELQRGCDLSVAE